MIRVIEVGPRDGLQNESGTIPTDIKVAFVNALSGSGVDEVEVSAFVSPQWVPQLADASEVLGKIEHRAGVLYSALVPNEQGMDRAESAHLDKISIFTAASDSFNQKNVNTTIDGTFKRMAPVVRRAKGLGLLVRGYVSTAFWCPYEGQIEPSRTLQVTQRLFDLGVDEVSIGDTIGKATPSEVISLLELMLQHLGADKLALHFHDTYGRAVQNVLAAYGLGITMFDASVGGLGGCPYAAGAPGNVATEVLVDALLAHGASVAVDPEALIAARAIIAPYVSRLRPLPGS